MCLTVSWLVSRAQSAPAKLQQAGEAFVLDREALELCTAGYPRRSACLCQLASHLSTRYELLGGLKTLSEAILLFQDARASPARAS